MFSNEIQEIGNAIAVLSPTQASELIDYLDITYGIELPACFAQEPPKEEPKKEEKPVEQTEWSVFLEGYNPEKKIALIKSFREITGMPLKESLEAVNNPPTKVRENIAKEEALKLKGLLEELGGKVLMK